MATTGVCAECGRTVIIGLTTICLRKSTGQFAGYACTDECADAYQTPFDTLITPLMSKRITEITRPRPSTEFRFSRLTAGGRVRQLPPIQIVDVPAMSYETMLVRAEAFSTDELFELLTGVVRLINERKD